MTQTEVDPALQKPRRKGRREAQTETRERILAAAAKCFARRGFSGSSVDDITLEAGFSRGAFYSNFRSKDEVLFLLFERAISADIAHLEAAEPGLRDIPHMWRAISERQRAQPADWCLLASEFQLFARRHPDRSARIRQAYAQHHAVLTAVLERLAAKTKVALPMPAYRIVAAVTGALQGLLMQKLVEERAPRELEADAVALMVAGIDAAGRVPR